jgi:hypothetical protein
MTERRETPTPGGEGADREQSPPAYRAPGYGAPGYIYPPGYGPPPGQAPPVYQAVPVAQPVKTNGLAIASLVLGILWLWWIGSALALVFGYAAKNQIDLSGGTQGGRGLAIAGIVLGWVGAGFFALFVLVLGASF